MKVDRQVGIQEDDCVWERDSVNDVYGSLATQSVVLSHLGIESAF